MFLLETLAFINLNNTQFLSFHLLLEMKHNVREVFFVQKQTLMLSMALPYIGQQKQLPYCIHLLSSSREDCKEHQIHVTVCDGIVSVLLNKKGGNQKFLQGAHPVPLTACLPAQPRGIEPLLSSQPGSVPAMLEVPSVTVPLSSFGPGEKTRPWASWGTAPGEGPLQGSRAVQAFTICIFISPLK